MKLSYVQVFYKVEWIIKRNLLPLCRTNMLYSTNDKKHA